MLGPPTAPFSDPAQFFAGTAPQPGDAPRRRTSVRRGLLLRASGLFALAAVSAPAIAQLPAVSQPTAAAPVEDRSRWSLHAQTDFLLYELRTPRSPVTWQRRRLVQRAGFREVVLLGDLERPWRLTFDLELRLDQEFGDVCLRAEDRCLSETNPDARFDHQVLVDDTRLDVPAGGIELRAPDGTRLRVGRSIVADPVGFLRLDGLRVQGTPHRWIAFDAFAGRQVTSAVFAGSVGFEPQGGLRLRLPEGLAPERVPFVDEPSAVFATGATVRVGDARILRGHVAFREVRDGDGVVARRIGAGLRSRPISGKTSLDLSASAVVDPTDGTFVDAAAEATVVHAGTTYGLRFTHHEPRFDLGTIWAYFDLVPTQRLTARVSGRVGPVDVGGALLGRRAPQPQQTERDGGLEGHVRLRRHAWNAGLRFEVWEGSLAPTASVLADVRRTYLRAEVYARASVWHFDHPTVPALYGTSTTLAIGTRAKVTEISQLGFEVEWSQNRIVGHRFRALASLGLRLAR